MEDPQSGETADLGQGAVAQVVEGQVELLQLVKRVVVVRRRQVAQLVPCQVQASQPAGAGEGGERLVVRTE